MSFEGIANSETYFYVDGLHFKGVSPVEESKRKGEFDNLAWFRKALLLQKDMNWTEPRRYNIGLGSDKAPGMRQIDNYTNASHLYGGKDEWLVNMGYSKEPQTSITLHFDLKGDYRFTNMSVVCQPVKNMSNRIDALKADPVEDLKFGTNEITASIDASKPKALFLSVPYSKGWTATVDGKPAEIKRANTAFMALELEPGHHEIELRYLTPGLREGMILSGIGLAALAGLALVRRILSTRVRRAQTTASASARTDVQASPQRQEEHERNSR
ncbi:YfhO family protein [Paraeggerthella sp.]|uniref:YfhO family protein n=1 Tax=Paraeggerthella sp. TaxID=2897350 RepID=UPI0035297D05